MAVDPAPPTPPRPSLSSTKAREGGPAVWRWATGELDLSRPVVMGIVNVTPDSFSDGSALAGDPERAADQARALVADGAAVVDLGGESTRPGAAEVPVREELRRVLPVLRLLEGRLDAPVSVDTRKAEVARMGLEAGAAIINDVSGLRHDPGLARVVAEADAGVVLMHMRGDPSTMVEHARYRDLVGEVRGELLESVGLARAAGIAADRIVLDPGLGFAKTAEQNLALLDRLGGLAECGFPLLVGPSRKSFLGHVLDLPPARRVAGTVAACVVAYLHGARIFRVHDVAPVVQALAVAEAIGRERLPEPGPGVGPGERKGEGTG